MMDVDDEARTTGRRVRQIRHARGQSLRVVAGLAGLSKSHLSRIERGERSLDSRSEIVALANALQIAPSELTSLPVPLRGTGRPGRATLRSSSVRYVKRSTRSPATAPMGRCCPRMSCGSGFVNYSSRAVSVGRLRSVPRCPRLIRDLHASIEAGRDVGELLDLAVLLHTQGSHAWLRVVGARIDLRSLAALVAHQAAEHREEPTTRGLAVWGDALMMLAAGDFALARAELDSVTVPTSTRESMQLEGMLALCRSLVAAADKRSADVDAALDYATELAQRTGEGNAYGLGFGPLNVALWRLSAVLEAGDHERAVTIAESLQPAGAPESVAAGRVLD